MTAAPRSIEGAMVRDARPEDAAALLALHRRGFGSDWTMADWRHRYVDGPTGRSRLVGAFDRDGHCLAMFGGVLLAARFGDRRGVVCRGGDVVVDPRLRRTAAGPRVLVRVCEAFTDGFVGSDVAMIFGFPSPGLTRTLNRQCRYEVMGDVLWLTRPARGCERGDPRIAVVRTQALPPDLETLSARDDDRRDFGLLRDRAYLHWRYERNPRGSHACLVARGPDRALRGVAIVRSDGPHDGAVIVNEWFGPADDGDTRATLLAAIAGLAVELGREHVVTCAGSRTPEFAALQRDSGFEVTVSPYQFVFRSFSLELTRRSLFERWRLGAGDFDFL